MLPSGVFSENYEQDKAILRTRLRWSWFFILLLLLALGPLIIPEAYLGALCLMSIFLIAVLGLQILVGYCGQINLGQSSFMGVGGIIGCWAAMKFNLSIEPTLIIGGLASAVYGLIFALPAIRLKGYYLALTTLAAQFIFHFVFTRVPSDFFFGTYGGFPVKSLSLLTGTTLNSPNSIYFYFLCI